MAFNEGVLFVDQWSESGEWRDINLSSFSCWVKTISIPLQLLTERNTKIIASNAGEVEEVQFELAQNVHWQNFIQFKVVINAWTAIFPGRFIPGNGKQALVQFKYERMPTLCYKCGIIDHEQLQCEAIQEVFFDGEGKNIPLYRPWIQADCHIRDCFKAAKLGDGKHLRKNGVFEKYKARKSMVRPKVTQSLLGEASDQLEKGLSKTYSP